MSHDQEPGNKPRLYADYDRELPKAKHWPEDRYAVHDTDGYRIAGDLSKEMAFRFAASDEMFEALELAESELIAKKADDEAMGLEETQSYQNLLEVLQTVDSAISKAKIQGEDLPAKVSQQNDMPDLLAVLAQAEQSIVDMAQDLIEPEALNHPDHSLEADFPVLTTIREAIAKGKANNRQNLLKTALQDMHTAYGRLHDGLSDMIESGRLTKGDIPDDYQWLVETLSESCNVANAKAENVLKQKTEASDRKEPKQ